MDEIMEYLNRLHAAANNVKNTMQPIDFPSVYFPRVSCVSTNIGINKNGQLIHKVVFASAAPGEEAFCRHIEQELAKKDWPNVSVTTEW